MEFARQTQQGVELLVHAQPGAKTSRLAGVFDGRLKVQVHAPPLEGRANKALCAYLADLLNVPKSQVEVIRGQQGRDKTVLVREATLSSLEGVLTP